MGLFDGLAEEIEARTSLDRIESRGTLRIALKQAGVPVNQATPQELQVVLERLMPTELRNRGVPEPEQVCAALIQWTQEHQGEAPEGNSNPSDVFGRFGA